MSADRRVVVITGASRGIGAGLVVAFRDVGYAVVATSRSIGDAAEGDVLTVQGDITQAESAERVMTATLERFGRVDCLVNNAGAFIGKPFTDYTPDDLAEVTTLNLGGFFHITQRAIRQMVAQHSGHVVTLTAGPAEHADSRTPAALTALTKGGLAAVTRSLAIEYATRGVRVNAVAPGVIRNPAYDAASYAGMERLHPLARLGEISDVTDAILYLERATFVTGETLHVDGGQAAGHAEVADGDA